MNLNKPYNYRELEKRFPEQPPHIVQKRIKRICDESARFGLEEVGDRADGFIHFVQRGTVGFSRCYSFGLWQIRHETDDDFKFDFNRFLSWLLMEGVVKRCMIKTL